MLAYAAFTPHPLISIPEIGKNQISLIQTIVDAFNVMSQELYSAKPEILLVISGQMPPVDGAFTINQRPQLSIDFSKYGDLSDHKIIQNDIGFGYRIKESVESEMPVVLTDETVLDYGAAVPLFHLTQHLGSSIRVAVIGPSNLSMAQHYSFGQSINRQVNITTSRIAVIASSDLSHGVQNDAGFEYNSKARAFNERIRTALRTKDVQSLLSLSEAESAPSVHDKAMRVALILFGILDDRAYIPRELAYDDTLGVGYLSAQFQV